MLKSKYIYAAVVAAAFAALTLTSGASPQRPNVDPGRGVIDSGGESELTPASPDPLSSTSTYYSVRPDVRECVSPMCGGYFVKRVNMSSTRCANGRDMTECYVAEIDWSGEPQIDGRKALLRGHIVAKRFRSFGNLGAFRVTEAWQAASDKKPTGMFYRVRDRGLRCVTFPCPTHYEARLNSIYSRNIAGVDLTGAAASDDQVSEASAAMTGVDGVIVAGDHGPVTGPGGRSIELKATQFYLRAGRQVGRRPPVKPPGQKKCFKTGCGNQVCADHNVITTCEWRPEYACYQKAACERQKNGDCGFTMTPELKACLAGK